MKFEDMFSVNSPRETDVENERLVSIIMAAYNAEKTIGRAIESVLSQSYQRFELLVVDDCSSDSTAEIVEGMDDCRIRLIRNSRNSGVSWTRKHALEHARGEWIAVLDSDDAWAPDKLEKQMKLCTQKNADLVFTGSAFMDAEGRPLNWILHVPEKVGYRQLLKQNLISNSSVLVRKDLYCANYVIGDLMHEDFAMWLKILKNGGRACGIDEPLLIYRLSKTSKSGNKVKAAKMNWNTYRYIGLNVVQAFYYECWYAIKGVLKYQHLR
ncbi:MAG: glycosyltransferase family 2 protein [Candidatus Faecivicinus sp.]